VPDRTDELVRELFADLRADELPTVRPPGAPAARRTVRRRRTAVSVGVTGLTVVAIAGLAFATARPAPGGGEAAPARQGSRLPVADLQQLAYRADAALDERGLGGPPVNDDPHLVMQRSTVLDSEAPAPQSHRLQAGEYHADLRCAGTGRVGFTFRWSPERADRTVDRSRSVVVGSGQAMCYEAPTAYSQPFTLTGTGRLEVVLSPDDEAVGHAGFAYQVIRFVEASDESAGNALAAAHDLRARHPGTEPVSMRTLHDHLGNNSGPMPRPTTMPLACRGPGTIRVEVFVGQVDDRGRVSERGATLADEEIRCRSTPNVVTLALGEGAQGNWVISVKPDPAARNRAGFAYLWPS
jgi:hypothetical protein